MVEDPVQWAVTLQGWDGNTVNGYKLAMLVSRMGVAAVILGSDEWFEGWVLSMIASSGDEPFQKSHLWWKVW